MSNDGPPLDRRAFFTQGFRRALGKAVETVSERVAPSQYVRPPGALPEPAFLGACTRCGKCTDVCPVHAISPLPSDHGLAAGTPALDVASRACVIVLAQRRRPKCPASRFLFSLTFFRGRNLDALVAPGT